LGWKADIADSQIFGDTNQMHPFPEASPPLRSSSSLSAMTSKICLGLRQIQFNFDKARIWVEGGLEHENKAGTVRRHNTDEDRLSPIFLHHLVGQKVRVIEVERFRLILVFDGGDTIRIFSDEGPYECGQTYYEDELVTVF
jgi:hypothetical protein